ncbi:DUF58 domain-containing protein [Terrilactibacillus sp. BCM23-1]|uniref:DUF58 domain-containing protein n=1 Tax=Terrilactibacillus tamarindi TaxID=2599694 RepID=A0A6N8CQY3_9BACI|nr:DUF58 domain-containing protein [Terrilactibacillus tamarindi]MTT31597.1 DUF58 domain-containing protein [Terrilactibacillus tamarindi]
MIKNIIVKVRETPYFGLLNITILLSLSFIYAMFQGGFVSWFIFYSFLPIVLYIVLLQVYPLRHIHVKRAISTKLAKAGETLTIELTITRKWPLPLFIFTIMDEVPSTVIDSSQQGKMMVLFWGKRQMTLQYVIPQIQRGEHTFEYVTLLIGDPFGFYQKKVRIPVRTIVLVYPAIHTIAHPTKDQQGMVPTYYDVEKDLTSLSGIRAYQSGDRLSWLDWKTTARTNQLATKQFDTIKQRHATIVMDLKTHHDDQFERSVSFCASLAQVLLKNGYTLELKQIGSMSSLVPRAAGDYQMSIIYQTLARLSPNHQDNSDGYVLDDRQQGTVYYYVMVHFSEHQFRLLKKAATEAHPIHVFVMVDKEVKMSKHLDVAGSPFFHLYRIG